MHVNDHKIQDMRVRKCIYLYAAAPRCGPSVGLKGGGADVVER